MIRLTRTIVSVSQKLQRVSKYSRDSGGNLRLFRNSEISLTTGKKRTEALEVPQYPIVQNIYKLDFLAGQRPMSLLRWQEIDMR